MALSYMSGLARRRICLTSSPKSLVRHSDDRWFDIVKWTGFALVQAEETDVT
jgi:hypothetical protein